jgi:hypothetical protein
VRFKEKVIESAVNFYVVFFRTEEEEQQQQH